MSYPPSDPNSGYNAPGGSYSLPDNGSYPPAGSYSVSPPFVGQQPEFRQPPNADGGTWKVIALAAVVITGVISVLSLFFVLKANNTADSASSQSQVQQEKLQAAFDNAGLPALYDAVIAADSAVDTAWDVYYDAEIGSSAEDAAWSEYFQAIGTCMSAVSSYEEAATSGGFTLKMFQAASLPPYINPTDTNTDCGVATMVSRNS